MIDGGTLAGAGVFAFLTLSGAAILVDRMGHNKVRQWLDEPALDDDPWAEWDEKDRQEAAQKGDVVVDTSSDTTLRPKNNLKEAAKIYKKRNTKKAGKKVK